MDYLKYLKKAGVKNAELYASKLAEQLPKFGITTEEDTLRFLANCSFESNYFKDFKESLYYTTEKRLIEVYPSAFAPRKIKNKDGSIKEILPPLYKASDYLRNSEKLANLVYDDRIFPKKSLGNIFNGDGFKYIGRSAIHVTGRANYQKLKEKTGVDFIKNPELLETPEYCLVGAMGWWQDNKLSSKNSLLGTRQAVVGNFTHAPFGLPEVTAIYNKMKA